MSVSNNTKDRLFGLLDADTQAATLGQTRASDCGSCTSSGVDTFHDAFHFNAVLLNQVMDIPDWSLRIP